MKRRMILVAVLATMLFGSGLTAYAAPQRMVDGAVFDAEWYAQQNPDIAAAFPGASPDLLYWHYATSGAKEGRPPYDVSTFDPAAVLPYAGAPRADLALPSLTPAESYNKDAQHYGSLVKSHLYKNEIGGVTRVEYASFARRIVAEDYDGSFYLRAARDIPMELSDWGGFYAGENYNFFIFGQDNDLEKNDVEVIRVVKYSKDWQRLGQASLYGANTTEPFRAGSLRCAEYGDYLYIRTCHQMYRSKDGLNHQASMTLTVRQSDMVITNSAHKSIGNPSIGYVSHSFDQYVLVDQEQNIVTLDLGDAHPRSLVLLCYRDVKAGGEKFNGDTYRSDLVRFPGETGENYTGAVVGGFAETTNGYVSAFSYVGSERWGDEGDRAVYIGYTNKSDLVSTATPITVPGMKTPILAPTGLGGGYMMWTDYNGAFYYTTYADGGAVGTIGTADAMLSDCQPIVLGGELVWFVSKRSWDPGPAVTFYRLNIATGAITKTGANGQ